MKCWEKRKKKKRRWTRGDEIHHFPIHLCWTKINTRRGHVEEWRLPQRVCVALDSFFFLVGLHRGSSKLEDGFARDVRM